MSEGAKLLSKVLDRVDSKLFEHGLVFKDDARWEEFGAKVCELIYDYYDDEGECDADDPDYDPNAVVESESSVSESLEESEAKRSRSDE